MASEAKMIEVEDEEYEYTAEKPWRDVELLQTLYWEKGMSQSEVADVIGCSQTTVSDWMGKLNVEARKPNHERPPNFHQTDGYEKWQHEMDDTKHTVRVHRLLAVAEYGFDAVCGNDVHHQNHIPWDNRPQNIELKSHKQHTRDHNDKQFGHEKALWREADKLRELYVEQKLNTYEIADKWGCGQRTVVRWLDKHGIETRSLSEATKLAHQDENQQTLTEAE